MSHFGLPVLVDNPELPVFDIGSPPHCDFLVRMVNANCLAVHWDGDHEDEVVYRKYNQGVQTRGQSRQRDKFIRTLPGLLRFANEITVWMCCENSNDIWGFAIRPCWQFSIYPSIRFLKAVDSSIFQNLIIEPRCLHLLLFHLRSRGHRLRRLRRSPVLVRHNSLVAHTLLDAPRPIL